MSLLLWAIVGLVVLIGPIVAGCVSSLRAGRDWSDVWVGVYFAMTLAGGWCVVGAVMLLLHVTT